ncbi:MAG: ATP synthase F1 subunit delta [Bacillota bacterium]
MLEQEAARKYGRALFELAERDGKLDAFSDQLKSLVSTLDSHAELRQFMFHPQVKAEVKKDTLKKVFGQDIDKMLLNLLMLLVDRRRISGINVVWDEFRQLVNKARNLEEAEVTTAVAISEETQTALRYKLSMVTGKNIVLHTKVNPAIVGGVVVRIGDKLIDSSVVRQLSDLRRVLTSSKLTRLG